MNETLTRTEAAAHAGLTAAALGLGRMLALWSLALLSIGLLVMWFSSISMFTRVCIVASLLAGISQQLFALRVALDAALFLQWHQSWSHMACADSEAATYLVDMGALDTALAAHGWIENPAGEVRGLIHRSQGALRLLKKQAVALVCQMVLMIAAIAIHIGY